MNENLQLKDIDDCWIENELDTYFVDETWICLNGSNYFVSSIRNIVTEEKWLTYADACMCLIRYQKFIAIEKEPVVSMLLRGLRILCGYSSVFIIIMVTIGLISGNGLSDNGKIAAVYGVLAGILYFNLKSKDSRLTLHCVRIVIDGANDVVLKGFTDYGGFSSSDACELIQSRIAKMLSKAG